MISQGDVYWVDLDEPRRSGPGFRRPMVVVQNDATNRSRINTVVVCAITSNLARAASPGNVTLRRDEANLPKRSVVNVSQIATLDKSQLTERIGVLSDARLTEILNGMVLLLTPTD